MHRAAILSCISYPREHNFQSVLILSPTCSWCCTEGWDMHNLFPSKEYPPAPYSRLSTQYHTDPMLTCCLSLDTKDSSWMSLWLQWSTKFVNRDTGIWIIHVLADSHENWAPQKLALGTATCIAQQLSHIYLLVCVAYIVCNVNCTSRTAGSVFCSSEFDSTPFSRCIFILKCTGMISKTVFIKPAGTDSTVISLCWDTYL